MTSIWLRSLACVRKSEAISRMQAECRRFSPEERRPFFLIYLCQETEQVGVSSDTTRSCISSPKRAAQATSFYRSFAQRNPRSLPGREYASRKKQVAFSCGVSNPPPLRQKEGSEEEKKKKKKKGKKKKGKKKKE